MPLATIEDAIADIRAGKMIVVMDDEDRENEGDLTMAAQMATADAINFMTKYGRGLICVPIIGRRLDELHIPMMVHENTSPLETAFTVSIEARGRTTTGISAHDRAATIAALLDPRSKPSDFVCPGHTFPLRSREGGVLVRAGQTEAAVDLSQLAGLYPAGVVCEILDDDGTMMRRPHLERFAREHDLKLITVTDLIAYRMLHEKLVERISTFRLPTRFGEFTGYAYESKVDQACHVAMVMGDIGDGLDVPVRVHSECLTGDALGSKRCDCAAQRDAALQIIAKAGRGVFLYLHQEGRGIGLANKLRAYELQDSGSDTVEANVKLGLPVDSREYGTGSQILHDLGVREMKIITNNPRKIVGLEGYGLKMTGRIPLIVERDEHNAEYLRTKKEKLGHLLERPV
jgi:3,4-dihydroxy 2-butanone 4-phosphate synthase/GTP cyclohydrolase II